jgi:hypothetical protein
MKQNLKISLFIPSLKTKSPFLHLKFLNIRHKLLVIWGLLKDKLFCICKWILFSCFKYAQKHNLFVAEKFFERRGENFEEQNFGN